MIRKLLIIYISVFNFLIAQVLYEEHFTGGVKQLTWYPFFGIGDTATVLPINTPEGDGWAGFVQSRADTLQSPSGLTYIAEYLDTINLEAWIYTDVSDSPGGPYQGLAFRVDPFWGEGIFETFIADFDDSKRLRLSLHRGPTWTPTILEVWTPPDFTPPETSGWHKLKLSIKGDSIWAYFDDELLPRCPIVDTTINRPSAGCVGVYTFRFFGIDSTIFDGFIVSEFTDINEKSISKPSVSLPKCILGLEKIPFNSGNLEIYDLLGRKLFDSKSPRVISFNKGVYFYILEKRKSKLIILK